MNVYGERSNIHSTEKEEIKASPLALQILAHFTESYPEMVAQKIDHSSNTEPFKDCVTQAVERITQTCEKNDPSIRKLIVSANDVLTLAKSPEQKALGKIVQENFRDFYSDYMDFYITTGKALQKQKFVSDGYFKLQPDLSPPVEAYEGRDFDGLTDAERFARRPSVDGYAVLFSPR